MIIDSARGLPYNRLIAEMSMTHRESKPSDRDRIRDLFLRPRAVYGLAEAASALGMVPETVREAIADGTIDAVGEGEELLLAWEEIMTLAVLRRWTPRIISNALPDAMVPPLAARERNRVDLPRYMWQLLAVLAAERAAAEDRPLTVSDLIEECVYQTCVAGITSLDEQIPGVSVAAEWPLVSEDGR
jgi:hypothetical protein